MTSIIHNKKQSKVDCLYQMVELLKKFALVNYKKCTTSKARENRWIVGKFNAI